MFASVLTTVLAMESQLRLPALFTDHMVVQRNKPISVWGWDKPNYPVEIELGGKKASTRTNSDGRFFAKISALKSGENLTLRVKGSTEKLITDVIVGEVWVCSGQSNMEWVVFNSNNRELAKADANPKVRMFTVAKTVSQTPLSDVKGTWVSAAENTVDSFSAVGYAYGVKLQKELGVPVGMIHTSWGGTPADAWLSEKMLESSSDFWPILDRSKKKTANFAASRKKYVEVMGEFEKKSLPQFFDDSQPAWRTAEYDESAWESVEMPHRFPTNFDGAYFYRKWVNLTQEEANSTETLYLGAIDDLDITYINNIEVGRTTMTTPSYYAASRSYKIPKGILKPGKNLIAIKAYDNTGEGGFRGQQSDIKLGNRVLDGEWKALKGDARVVVDPKITGPAPQVSDGSLDQNDPATLYNGMLKPLAPYSIRGAIWYQGESNAWRANQYRTLLPAMIKDWRQIFDQGDFPFFIVQLANWMKPDPNQFDSQWAELRDAQDFTGQQKNCGTATIIDIGDAADIHPRNKRDVGERLARIALNRTYKAKVEYQGPRLKSAKFDTGSVVLEMNHANGLRTVDGQEPRCFAVCGSDKKWQWATAAIEGNRIVLRTAVQNPVAVRYAWQDNPPVNLVNRDGLPAMPFRTDKFTPITKNNL